MVVTTLVILLLIYAESVLIPFVISILIWFVIKKFRDLIDRMSFAKKYIPRWIKTLFASLFIFSVLFYMAHVLIVNIQELSQSYTTYLSNAELIGEKIHEMVGIDIKAEIVNSLNKFDVSKYLQSFINSLSEILGSMMMIVFYTVFIFVEESLFDFKIRLIFKEGKKYESYFSTAKKIDKTMSRYIGLKSLIALTTATLGYVVLLFAGIEAPLFWGFLLFTFNFIPSVGPILASLLPAVFSLIQFGEFGPFLIIITSLTAISLLVGNFIEPKLMGNTLNISPLAAILSLAVWGALWGITGMLLSVPITVAMIIIFSQFPNTRSISILLSQRGRL